MKEIRIWVVIGCILMIGTGVTLYTRFYVGSRGTAMETTAAMSQEAGEAMAPGISEGIQVQKDGSGEGSVYPAGPVGDETRAGMEAASGAVGDAPALGVQQEDAAALAGEVMEDRAFAVAKDEGEKEAEARMQTEAPGTAVISEAGPLSQDAEAAPAKEAPISPLTGGRMREEKNSLMTDYRKRLEDLDIQIQKIREEETGSNVYSIKTSANTELRMWESEMNAVYNALMETLPSKEAADLAAKQQEWLKNRDAKAAEHTGRGGGSIEGIGYASTLASLTRERAYELVDQYEEANGYILIEERDIP